MNSYCSFSSVVEANRTPGLCVCGCLLFCITLSFYNVCDYEYDERLNVYHKNLLLIGDEQKKKADFCIRIDDIDCLEDDFAMAERERDKTCRTTVKIKEHLFECI